jgi:hypothetical protein
VTDGVITSYRVETGENVYGPECGQVSGSNEMPDTEVPIEDGEFSWGGEGEGYPVTGSFESDTAASGTAVFSPDEVGGELPQGCEPNDATWEAARTG